MSGMLALAGARLLRCLPAETAHGLAVSALEAGFGPADTSKDDPVLAIDTMGLHFPNPVGIAAGFDKDARAPDALLRLGFGFAEAGTVTPRPQPGNTKPRMFRLEEDRGVINRLGFNNQGLDAFCARLRKRAGRPGIVGANIGANKDSEDRIADYLTGLAAVRDLASYVTVNVSSPNTPGLRDLQARDALSELASRLAEAAKGEVKLVLKIAPDLATEDVVDAVEIAIANGFSALIVSNTTITREGLKSANQTETGGLSGAPLFALSTAKLREAAEAASGRITLIGAGGISSGADAYAKIRAGASLVQLYTAFGYEGPALIPRLKRELAACLKRDGYAHLADAVGADLARKA